MDPTLEEWIFDFVLAPSSLAYVQCAPFYIRVYLLFTQNCCCLDNFNISPPVCQDTRKLSLGSAFLVGDFLQCSQLVLLWSYSVCDLKQEGYL